MQLRKIIALVSALMLLGAATVWANDGFEWYKGKNVSVFINDEAVNSGGLLMEQSGQVMLPLRDIADTLQAIVDWDAKSQTVRMYKPNVHIFLSTRNNDGSFGTFGKVFHRETHNFFIFAQIDSLVKDVDALKFTIENPQGEQVYEHTHQLKETTQDTLWLPTPNIKHRFEQRGEYTVKLYMKLSSGESFHLVSEKAFHSVSR